MPRRAGAQFRRRGGASIPSLFLLMLLTGREGSWEVVFLAFSCAWKGRGKRPGAVEGISVADGAEIPSGQCMCMCMCVCVRMFMRGSAHVASFLSVGIFLQFWETIFRKPFIKTLVSSSEVSKESLGQRGNPIMF